MFFPLDSWNNKMLSFYKQQTYFSQIVKKKKITILSFKKNSENNNIIFDFRYLYLVLVLIFRLSKGKNKSLLWNYNVVHNVFSLMWVMPWGLSFFGCNPSKMIGTPPKWFEQSKIFWTRIRTRLDSTYILTNKPMYIKCGPSIKFNGEWLYFQFNGFSMHSMLERNVNKPERVFDL